MQKRLETKIVNAARMLNSRIKEESSLVNLSNLFSESEEFDYVAAAKMILTDGWKHAKAVYDARCEFHRLKSDFYPSRQENLAKAIQVKGDTNPIPERIPQSLLWLYYAKGKKKFSDIFPKVRS